MLTQPYTMLQRNLLYTAVTGGKKLVVLVGQKKAVAIAVRNVTGRRRWSKLKELLEECAGRQSQGADSATPARRPDGRAGATRSNLLNSTRRETEQPACREHSPRRTSPPSTRYWPR